MKKMRLAFSAIMIVGLLFTFLAVPAQVTHAESLTATVKPLSPVTISPGIDTITNKPTFIWTYVSNASSYGLVVYDISAAKYVVTVNVSRSYCSTATMRCTYTPSTSLIYNKNYRWNVRSTNTAGSSLYSPGRNFTPRAGFISTFNYSRTGWYPLGSDWYSFKNSSYYTFGAPNKWSSMSYYYKSYSNFTFEAKVMKNSPAGYSYGLIFRGTPSFDTDYDWKNAYYFLLMDNTYGIWITKNGIDTKIQDWTVSPNIVQNSWNALKVVTDGNRFRFFINGHLEWAASDSTLSLGRVGVATYRKTGYSSFYVDWAVLSKSTYYTTATAALSMPDDFINNSSSGSYSGIGKEGNPSLP